MKSKVQLLKTVRVMFVIFCAVSGFIICSWVDPKGGIGKQAMWGMVSFIVAVAYVYLESKVEYVPPRELLVGILGLTSGLIVAQLVIGVFPVSSDDPSYRISKVMLNVFLSYFGLVVALRYSDRISFSGTRWTLGGSAGGSKKILDTSVLIDGRIADIVETGFVEGPLVIPNFVLRELQTVADSSDPIRRKRGRRGLDVLKRLQEGHYAVQIAEEEPGTHRMDVDEKLVLLAKEINASIVTNDFNLNKVASIQDIVVLNINDLTNALRPVVLPGESM
ncbi:MAG TPA: PIN domain nuclease, partial [bacterium]|nr:PIN domain nuclease [bacterium]